MAYLLAELGASGHLDSRQRLVIQGRFLPEDLEEALDKYIGERSTARRLDSVSGAHVLFKLQVIRSFWRQQLLFAKSLRKICKGVLSCCQ